MKRCKTKACRPSRKRARASDPAVRKATAGLDPGVPGPIPQVVSREELERNLEGLREEVRVLRLRLQGAGGAPEIQCEPSPVGPHSLAPVPRTSGTATPARPLPSRLADLQVVAANGSAPTRVLPAHEPFEVRVALELGPPPADGVTPRGACQVSVRARRLGGGERWIVSQATQAFAPATEALGIRLRGFPLPPGLYRLEASASLGARGEALAGASTYLDGGLISVL